MTSYRQHQRRAIYYRRVRNRRILFKEITPYRVRNSSSKKDASSTEGGQNVMKVSRSAATRRPSVVDYCYQNWSRWTKEANLEFDRLVADLRVAQRDFHYHQSGQFIQHFPSHLNTLTNVELLAIRLSQVELSL